MRTVNLVYGPCLWLLAPLLYLGTPVHDIINLDFSITLLNKNGLFNPQNANTVITEPGKFSQFTTPFRSNSQRTGRTKSTTTKNCYSLQ